MFHVSVQRIPKRQIWCLLFWPSMTAIRVSSGPQRRVWRSRLIKKGEAEMLRSPRGGWLKSGHGPFMIFVKVFCDPLDRKWCCVRGLASRTSRASYRSFSTFCMTLKTFSLRTRAEKNRSFAARWDKQNIYKLSRNSLKAIFISTFCMTLKNVFIKDESWKIS